MSIPTKLPNFNLEIFTPNNIIIKDDFDDIVGECGLWIAQERLYHGKLPFYSWELFNKIKKRHRIVEDEHVYL